ncbi:MAG: response regulator, partial [Deltaproteobacteria bacterium]|nr:response regulator [Deltaproteobacteria bacterium]
ANELPDILLLDFQMPVMNGLEVLKSIRGDPALQKLPVIMLSANRDTEKYVTAAGLSADRYIIKPFEMCEITEAIQSLVTVHVRD